MHVRWSPNWNERPAGAIVDAVVIHYTDMPMAQALDRLCDPGSRVSTHFVIGRDGMVWQLVPVEKRAWHAGVSELDGRANVNDFSIGIDLEFVAATDTLYTDAQYASLSVLLSELCTRFAIPSARVVGHEQVARPAGRKADPGPCFDWRRTRATRS